MFVNKGKQPIKETNIANQDPKPNGLVKDLVVVYNINTEIGHIVNDHVDIPHTHNQFDVLEVVLKEVEDSKGSSPNKEFVNATPLFDDYTVTIENPSRNENEDFLKCSWDNLQNNVDEIENLDID